MCIAWPAHLIFLDLITLITFDEEFKLLISLQHDCLQYLSQQIPYVPTSSTIFPLLRKFLLIKLHKCRNNVCINKYVSVFQGIFCKWFEIDLIEQLALSAKTQ
jgi:hypothetical protein